MTDSRAGQANIFISYQRSDEVFARQVREHLAAAGVRTWMDQYDIPVGAYWPDEIDKGLSASDIVVGILSPDAVESRNVKNEWDWAIQNDRRLLLLQYRPCVIPHRYISINYIDATQSDVSQPLNALLATLGVAPTTAGSTSNEEAVPAMRHRPRRAAQRVAPLVVGREREQAELAAALDEMLDGRGSLVLIGGEAGIGKTTLTTWLAWKAEQEGAIVVSGGCYDLSTTRPYGPWVELLWGWPEGDGLPPIPTELRYGEEFDAVRSQNALFELAASFLTDASASRPLVLLLEDLHWADQASLDLLRSIVRVVSNQRLLLVVTYRDDEITRRHPLYSLLPGLAREPNARRVSLRRLDSDATGALVAARYPLPAADRERLVDYVQRATEGNPFFASEVLRVLEETGRLVPVGDAWQLESIEQVQTPTLVRQVIDGRLARLGDDARRSLELAAIIGHDVPVDLWVELSGADEGLLTETLERAIEARLVEEQRGGASFRFTHALIRETLYEGVVSLRRHSWHRQVAEALSGSPRPDPDPIAHHFQQAGDRRAFDWLIQAAERAEATFATVEAASRYEAALEIHELHGGDAQTRALLLYQVGFQLRYVDDRKRSRAYIDDALALARQSGNRAVEVAALFDHGVHLCWIGDMRRGLAEMESAADLFDTLNRNEQARIVGRPGAPLDNPMINDNRGMVIHNLSTVGRHHEAVAIGSAFLEGLPADPGRVLRPTRTRWADTYIGLARSLAALGQVDDAQQMLRRGLAAFQRAGDAAMMLWLTHEAMIRLYLPYLTDRVDERHRLIEEVVEETRRQISSVPVTLFGGDDAIRLPNLVLDGEWDRAAIAAAYLRDNFLPFERPKYGNIVARIQLYRGERDEAARYIATILPDGPGTDPDAIIYDAAVDIGQTAAEIALEQGDLDLAEGWIRMRERTLDHSGEVTRRPGTQLLWSRYHRLRGDTDAAITSTRQALALASSPRQPLALLIAHRALGELLIDGRQFEDAGQHLNDSLTLAVACAAPFERALTLVALAELELVSGRQDSAQQRLAVARETCERLGARPALERIARLAAALR